MSSAQGHRAQQGALRRPGGVKPQRSSHDTFRPHRQPFKRRLTEGHHLEGATRHKGGGSHEQCILILEIRTLGAENLIWPIMMQSEPPPRGGHTALGTIVADEPKRPSGPPPATAPPDYGNSTAGTRGAAPPAAGATAPPATSAVSNTIAPPVDEKSCGADTGHINICLSQTSHDVSTCAPSDDFCLCQAYANLANCYNGCDSLHSQQQQYQQQSDQHCNAPGVADKLRAAKNSPSNLPPGPPSDNHDPRTSARSAASADFQFPFHGFLTLISSTLALAVF
ncbi:hypothetical protein PCASD_22955 [Puccinia coronata f. sp. avenae]|uniref:Uncharacterized protein n=1 Tax=Puccinia coronata f. sp. avenae TaxID=200324 RepID=A0A2N5U0B7_9BASI|nr:hypothetical protein PCASD_22955 [Puccinia coronata f. sp. avenae]